VAGTASALVKKESAHDRAVRIDSRPNRIGERADGRDGTVRKGSAAECLAEPAAKNHKEPEPAHP
jgi:hypothetical protein